MLEHEPQIRQQLARERVDRIAHDYLAAQPLAERQSAPSAKRLRRPAGVLALVGRLGRWGADHVPAYRH